MNEILLLLLGIVGIFAVGCSIALLALGKMIDQFPTGDESKRTRSIASPIETTRISVVIFWALFIVGTWAIVQESRFLMIAGITTFFAICLFMLTALIFSFAVLNTMRGRRLADRDCRFFSSRPIRHRLLARNWSRHRRNPCSGNGTTTRSPTLCSTHS